MQVVLTREKTCLNHPRLVLHKQIREYWCINTLRNLTCYAKENSVDFDDWGVCNHRDVFWVGNRVTVNGKNALQVSLLDILEDRDERYPDWGDEEINLFVGTDAKTGEFKWFLLNKEEWRDGGSSTGEAHA